MLLSMSGLDSLKLRSFKSNMHLISSIQMLEDQLIPNVIYINYSELKAAMVSLGFDSRNAQIFQMISDLDEDGSG